MLSLSILLLCRTCSFPTERAEWREALSLLSRPPSLRPLLRLLGERQPRLSPNELNDSLCSYYRSCRAQLQRRVSCSPRSLQPSGNSGTCPASPRQLQLLRRRRPPPTRSCSSCSSWLHSSRPRLQPPSTCSNTISTSSNSSTLLQLRPQR